MSPALRSSTAPRPAPSPGFRIVGAAGDGESALDLVRLHRLHIALLDLEMPNRSGLEVAEAIRDEELGTAVVMLTIHRDAGIFQRALDLGTRGYILKDSAVTEIVARLRMVASGRPYISPAMSGDLLERRAALATPEIVSLADLTLRREGGAEAHRSGAHQRRDRRLPGQQRVRTLEHHRTHISRKLGLTGPQRLLRFVLEHEALLE